MDKRKQKKLKRALAAPPPIQPICPNCGERGRHFMPPCFGEEGRYICEPKAEWQLVSFSSDCDEEGNCMICGIDYAECECPGPTQDGYEYKEHDGILFARKVADAD